jgi:uncharacterized phage infection (PIP) family protein YhgE
MHRRTVMAGVAAGCSTAIAGCTSSLGGGDGARSHIEAGVESLSEATDILDTHKDRWVGKGPVFDANQVTTHTETAREEFDAARTDASAERQTLIENLGHLADMIDGLAAVYEAVDRVLADLDAIGKLVNSERFDEANTKLEETRTNLETVTSNVQTVTAASKKVDDDVYTEFEEIDRQTFESWSTDMGAWVDGTEYIVGGFDPFLDAMTTFDTATTKWEDRQFEAAASRFDEARQQFDSALEEFRSGKEEGPNELQTDFQDLACKQETFRDGMKHYTEAMRSAADGDADAYDQAVADAKNRLETTC